MGTQIKRKVFDFFAADHTTEHPDVQVLYTDPAPVPDRALPPYASLKKGDCVQRWHLSLRGEDNPMVSSTRTSPEADADQAIYRYDWTFGITVIEGLYWDWQEGLCDDSVLAVHIALEPLGDAPEAVPIGATLSTLRPSRNTRSHWETALPKIGKAAADVSRREPARSPPGPATPWPPRLPHAPRPPTTPPHSYLPVLPAVPSR